MRDSAELRGLQEMKGCQSLLLIFVLWGGWLPCSTVADNHGELTFCADVTFLCDESSSQQRAKKQTFFRLRFSMICWSKSISKRLFCSVFSMRLSLALFFFLKLAHGVHRKNKRFKQGRNVN